MSKAKSIVIKIRFIDLMNKPFPNLYHLVRESKKLISENKSDTLGLGVPISRPPGTVLTVSIKHPLTNKMINIQHPIIVPTQKGTMTIKAPFSIQTVKLRQSTEGGSTLRKTYKIEPDDTLYSIAKKFDTTWQILFELNKDTIKKPDEIFPGQWIKVPPKGSSLTGKTNDEPDSLKNQTNYNVKKGETLSGISQRSGVSVEELKRLNGISEPKTLQAGQTIKLRGSGSAKPQTSSKPTPTPVTNPKTTTSSSTEKEEGFFDGAMGTITDIAKGTVGIIGGAVGSIGDGLGSLSEKAKEGFGSVTDAMSGGRNDKTAGQKTGSGNNTPSALGTYTVKSGDTLSGIAQKHGVNTNDLARANGLKLTDTIRSGDRLTIPKGGSSNNPSTSSDSSSQSNKTNNPIEVTIKPSNSTNGTPKEVATTNGACVCKVHDLIWSGHPKVTCEFRKKVVEICQDLWPDNYLAMANNLMACMYFESAKTFSPKIDNKIGKDEDGYGYIGLIQFGNDACIDLNVKKKHLVKMSAVEQLEWVKKYFLLRERNKLINDLVGMYMCINYPKNLVESRMKPDDIVYTSDKKAYRQNPSFFKEKGELDRTETINKNGKEITKYLGFENGKTYIWEVSEEMQNFYKPGEKKENRSFSATCSQVVQPPSSSPDEIAPWMKIAKREAKQWAGYHESKAKSKASKTGSKGVITDNYHKLVGIVIGGNKPYTPSLETAWCASFINYCLKESNYSYSKDPSSQFPTRYPEKFVKISKPIFGAFVVYKHTKPGNGTGHVSLLYAKLDDGDYGVLGGNQGQSITLNTHKGVYLDSLECKLIGYYIPKSYLPTAEKLINSDGGFGPVISLSEAKKSISDSTGLTLKTT